jgi:hypothetical protein
MPATLFSCHLRFSTACHILFPTAASLTRPQQWQSVTSDTCVQMMNGAIHEELAPFLAPTVQRVVDGGGAAPGGRGGDAAGGPSWQATYGFFEASAQKAAAWNVDGVHYKPEWYDRTMETMLRMFCPGDAPA